MQFDRAMREATELTRAQKLEEATELIQAALQGGSASGKTPASGPHQEGQTPGNPLLEGRAQALAATQTHRTSEFAGQSVPRAKWSLREVVRTLREARSRTIRSAGLRKGQHVAPPVPAGAQFLNRSFTASAGSRTYKLYVPAGRETIGLPLIVMLHGCTQNPDDFAVGTQMNALAEEFGFLVAYPCQPASANPSSCWNWFEPKDQMRGRGEPSIIAGLTEEIVAEYHLDRGRIFVAGLSAGGAMAAVMGATYPDLFAAIGVHSGLAHGSARDVMSAFAAMRGEFVPASAPRSPSTQMPRTIVFHGDADRTVHPVNAARIMGASDSEPDASPSIETGIAGGRSFTRRTTRGRHGEVLSENWLVSGAGHAWSGGNANGSYADPAGPDASRAMIRFFLGR